MTNNTFDCKLIKPSNDIKYRFIFYILVYLLFVYPIIHANYFYIDDLGRSLHGYAGWLSQGRPIADYISQLLNFSKTLSDIAPLTQIIAIIVMAATSAFMSLRLGLKKNIQLLIISFIGCSPFFLENWSYRFDSVTMSFAVLFSLLPFIIELTQYRKFSIYTISLTSLILSYNTYQPAISDFIVFSVFLSIITLNKSIEKSIKTFFYYFSMFCFSSLLYKIEITYFDFTGTTGYAAQHSNISFSYDTLINTSRSFINFTSALLNSNQEKVFLFSFIVCFILFSLNISLKKSSALLKIITVLLSFVFLIMMTEAIIGPMIFLKSPIFAPRVMIGVGAFMACASFFIISVTDHNNKKIKTLGEALLTICLLGQFVISYAYGNAIYSQEILQSSMSYNINNELYNMAHKKNIKYHLSVNGTEPISPRTELSYKNYPVIRELLPLPLDLSWGWGGKLLDAYGKPKNIRFYGINQKIMADISRCDFKKINNYMYYNIYKNGSTIVLDFNKSCS
jgi:hypothetical protein